MLIEKVKYYLNQMFNLLFASSTTISFVAEIRVCFKPFRKTG